MRDPRQVAVVGVAGYTGLELAGILLRHPAVASTTFYVRETRGAHCIAELFPQFRGWGQAPLRSLSLDSVTSSAAGTAFLATPHEVSVQRKLHGAWREKRFPRRKKLRSREKASAEELVPNLGTAETVRQCNGRRAFRARRMWWRRQRDGAGECRPARGRCTQRHLRRRLGEDLSFHQGFNLFLKRFAGSLVGRDDQDGIISRDGTGDFREF